MNEEGVWDASALPARRLAARSLLTLYGVLAAYAAWAVASFPGWTADDAFILFRYADNLAHHGQFTFNLGEDPVEGYTGLLLPLTLAVASFVGVAPAVTAKLVGISCFFAGAVALFGTARALALREPIPLVLVATYVCTPELLAHAHSGLETNLFIALLGACAYAVATKRDSLFVVACLAVSLTRPEGVAATIGFLTVVVWGRRQAGREAVRSVLTRFAFGYGVPAVAYFVWRVAYYGRLFPNTFYAKVADEGPNSAYIMSARGFADEVLLVGGVAYVLAVAARLVLGLPHPFGRPSRSTLVIVVPSVAFVVVCGIQYSRSHLMMDYGHRFACHAIVLLLLGMGAALDSVRNTLHEAARFSRVYGVAAKAVALALLAAHFSTLVSGRSREVAYYERYSLVLEGQHRRIGLWLLSWLPSAEHVACIIDAGIIPYVSGHRAIDFGRLNDERLARPGLRPDDFRDYFFERRPGVVVISAVGNHVPPKVQKEAESIVDDERFSEWRLERTFATEGIAARELVFVRADLAQRIRAEVQ